MNILNSHKEISLSAGVVIKAILYDHQKKYRNNFKLKVFLY